MIIPDVRMGAHKDVYIVVMFDEIKRECHVAAYSGCYVVLTVVEFSFPFATVLIFCGFLSCWQHSKPILIL